MLPLHTLPEPFSQWQRPPYAIRLHHFPTLTPTSRNWDFHRAACNEQRGYTEGFRNSRRRDKKLKRTPMRCARCIRTTLARRRT